MHCADRSFFCFFFFSRIFVAIILFFCWIIYLILLSVARVFIYRTFARWYRSSLSTCSHRRPLCSWWRTNECNNIAEPKDQQWHSCRAASVVIGRRERNCIFNMRSKFFPLLLLLLYSFIRNTQRMMCLLHSQLQISDTMNVLPRFGALHYAKCNYTTNKIMHNTDALCMRMRWLRPSPTFLLFDTPLFMKLLDFAALEHTHTHTHSSRKWNFFSHNHKYQFCGNCILCAFALKQ